MVAMLACLFAGRTFRAARHALSACLDRQCIGRRRARRANRPTGAIPTPARSRLRPSAASRFRAKPAMRRPRPPTRTIRLSSSSPPAARAAPKASSTASARSPAARSNTSTLHTSTRRTVSSRSVRNALSRACANGSPRCSPGATLHLASVQQAGARVLLDRLSNDAITMIYAVPRAAAHADAARPPRPLRCASCAWVARRCCGATSTRCAPGSRRTADRTRLQFDRSPIMQWFVPADFPRDGARVPLGYPLHGNALAILGEDGKSVAPG